MRHGGVLALIGLRLGLVAELVVDGTLGLLLGRSHIYVASLNYSILVYLRFLNVRCYLLSVSLIALPLHTLHGLPLRSVLHLNFITHTESVFQRTT